MRNRVIRERCGGEDDVVVRMEMLLCCDQIEKRYKFIGQMWLHFYIRTRKVARSKVSRLDVVYEETDAIGKQKWYVRNVAAEGSYFRSAPLEDRPEGIKQE